LLKRAVEFLRSVIPADPFQLFFLAGIVCLIVAHGGKWSLVKAGSVTGQSANWFGQLLQVSGPLFVYLIIFAGVAGYFVCFWPGRHPVRRILLWVLFPTLAGVGLMFGRLAYLSGSSSSVLESTSSVVADRIHRVQTILWELPGFQFSLVGVLLIAIFTSRLVFGISTLPLALPSFRTEAPESWRRVQLLIWFLVSLIFLPLALLSFLTIGSPLIATSRLPSFLNSDWFTRLSSIIEGAVVLGIALWIMGKDGRATARSSIRLPNLKWPLMAAAFPIGIDIFISFGQYALNRAQWAAGDFGRFEPPQLASYFNAPEVWLLLLFFGAFFEEVIFRGVLQTRFTRRYGLYRGIFLVGIVWAAFHFFSDFSFVRFTDQEALMKLSFRMFMGLALTFVLAWLTIRSESIIPAAIAHTLYNVLVFSPIGPPLAGKNVLRVALWAGLAYVLFRYWPVPSEIKLETVTTAESPEADTGDPCGTFDAGSES
jgi:membrane protease YdiL (CAAX protease family)